LEVGADALGALVQPLLQPRPGELVEETEQHDERDRSPDQLVGRRQDRARRLLAVVDGVTVLELLVAFLRSVVLEARARGLLRAGDPPEGEHTHDDEEGAGEPCAGTHDDQPEMMKASTKPNSASASVNAIPRNIVVRAVPAASGWRDMAVMALATTRPM